MKKKAQFPLWILMVIVSLWLVQGALAQIPALTPQVPLPGNKIPQFVDPLPGFADLGVITAGTSEIVLNMTEFQAPVMPTGFIPALGPYTGTWVWGYLPEGQTSRTTYLGPIILATRDVPTQIRYRNNLPTGATTNVLAYKFSTDQTLMWADPLNADLANLCALNPLNPSCSLHYEGSIPTVPHLHGGDVPPQIDGGPDAWFTGTGIKGHAYYTHPGVSALPNEAVYRYPNGQESALVWFHDHALGATRLNVYAGLAGGYLITDPANTVANLTMPAVPLIIQDRMFDTNGQLYFPSLGINPEHPYWVPEFVGDTIVVNGKVWPFLNVQAKRYRFLIVNGSNARTYELYFINKTTGAQGPVIWQIGTDGGFLDAPVLINPNVKGLSKLLIMPGERADIIVDFAAAAGQTLLLANTGRTPYPNGAPVSGRTTGRIMQFNVAVGAVTDTSCNPAAGGCLRPVPMVRLANAGAPGAGVVINKKRQLTLVEIMGAGGPLEVLLNNSKWTGMLPSGSPRPQNDFTAVTVGGFTKDYSEISQEGETEQWEIINLTADAHPMHLHLVQFQILNRQPFDVKGYNAAYATAYGGIFQMAVGPPFNYNTLNADSALGGNPAITPFLTKGPARLPALNEAGWKDTVIMLPGEVTRIIVRYAPMSLPANTPAANAYFPFSPDGISPLGQHGYVWHCHIIDHEDNEMMRPNQVKTNPIVQRTYIQGIDY